jgi:hypothetical protein
MERRENSFVFLTPHARVLDSSLRIGANKGY